MTEYEVTVIEHADGRPDVKEITSGGPKTTAAFLRAKADEIDPPQPKHPVLRAGRPYRCSHPECRGHTSSDMACVGSEEAA